ncbi:MAG: beta-galactosidase BgaS [Nitrososphaerota archaeon]|nr:beta-galactosidase BgaS [Candidatus Calditenuaceae archaeon]MDW8073336.1 beta-galactosidase BgaS [Nitrososphaerota archaeon]
MCAKFSLGADFRFGFSTVGVQHEMGTPDSEFSSDWVAWLHDPENIVAGIVSGDRPEDGPGYWGLYKEDHERARSIGMDAAWITVEWARIFPRATFDVKVQEERSGGVLTRVMVEEKHLKELEKMADMKALNHYREILSDWRSRGGLVIVNLFHWSLPLWLHDPIKVRKQGPDRANSGWADEKCVVEFAKFSAFIAQHLDDLVDMWYTMNEPSVVANAGYLQVRSGFPPGYLDLQTYLSVTKHLGEAHAVAYDSVKSFSKKPIGVVESVAEWMPLTPKDRAAAERGFEFNVSIYDVAQKGLLGGGVVDEIRGRLDWVGLNYYSRIVVEEASELPSGFKVVEGYGYSCEPRSASLDGRPTSDFGWEVYPEGLYNVLTRLHNRYRLPIYVTENGCADSEDRIRPRLLVSHLYQIHRAQRDGLDVRGYFHWNLTDNLEWSRGYSMRFGLFEVDNATKRRYARPSALVFREIASAKAIPEEFEHMTKPPLTSR